MITNETGKAVRNILYGRSDDVKPIDVPNASTFFEIDTSKKFWFDETDLIWHEDTSSGGGGGGGDDPVFLPNDVTLYGAFGNIIASYTLNEFRSLENLPDAKNIPGLISQGWNWSIDAAKSYLNKYGKLDIGCIFSTRENSTNIYIETYEPNKKVVVGLKINGTVTIDWGDATSASILSGSNFETKYSEEHLYSSNGSHVIKITTAPNSYAKFTGNSSNGSLIVSGAENGSPTKYKCIINKIEIGANFSIDDYGLSRIYTLESVSIPIGCAINRNAFSNDYALKSVVIPSGINSIGDYAFLNDYNLQTVFMPEVDDGFYIGNNCFENCGINGICIPEGVNTISQNVFNNCTRLRYLILPDTIINKIGNSSFNNCCSLNKLIIPENVTSIGSSSLYKMFSLKEIHFKSNNPPTAESSTTFDGPTEDCIIYVPTGKLSAYTSSTNYFDSTLYTYIEE